MKIDIKPNIFANSTSKQKWSFSKSSRFIDPKVHDCSFYNTPSSLDKRSASFGVGKRPDIANTGKISADPTKYEVPSSFQNKKRGFSFGTGRDQTKFQNYLKTIANSSTFYNLNDSSLHKGKAFSIKQRTQYPPNYFLPNEPESERLSRLPGPSSYEVVDKLGQKCITSNKKSIGYHFPHSKRFRHLKTIEVGPGSYDDKTITADGDYVLSNMRSSGRRTIFKGKRTNIFVKTETIPGPGQYSILGDFGKVTMHQTIDLSGLQSQRPKRPQTARH